MSSRIKSRVVEEDTSYHGFVEAFSDGLFMVTIIGGESETVKPQHFIETKNFKKFIKNFSKTFNSSFKSIIFKIVECFDGEKLESIKICQQLKEQVEKLKIPYYFISSEMCEPTCALAALKFTCETGDIIFIPVVCSNYIYSYAYRREADGYVNIRQKLITFQVIINTEAFRTAFYGGLVPKKIVAIPFPSNPPMLNTLRNIVDPKKLVIAPEYNAETEIQLVLETYKWLCDPALNNAYHFKPRSTRRFYVSQPKKSHFENDDVVVDYNEELPLSRKYFFPRTISQLHLTYNKGYADPDIYFFKTCTPEKGDGHRYELHLTIDENNIPTAEIKNAMIQQIQAFPNILNHFMKSRDPVIMFFDNSSIILIFNEKLGKYEFLESWNGIYGKDIFLNLQSQTDKKSHIFTFTEIGSLSDCQPIRTFIKNATTKSTLQFNSRKHSAPAFLMALILQEHCFAIKKETGICHKKLGLHYFHSNQESKKVEEGRKNNQKYILELEQTFQRKREILNLLVESCKILCVQYSDEATKVLENVGYELD